MSENTKEPKNFGPLAYGGFIFLGLAALGKKPEGMTLEQSSRDRNNMALIGTGLIAAQLLLIYQRAASER